MRTLCWIILVLLICGYTLLGGIASVLLFGQAVVAGVRRLLRRHQAPRCRRCAAHELKSARELARGHCWRCTLGEDLETKRRPLKLNVVLLHCRWCETNTFHVKRGAMYLCEHQAEHAATEAYRRLAAALPDPETYRACICAPGERTLFHGKADPFCFAREHRP